MRSLVLSSLVLAGCQFDGSGVPSTGDLPAFSDSDTASPESQEATEFVASSEETKRGLLTGTYVESHVLDGQSETILAEIDKGNERLEHRWFFDEIPAGQYQLTLVVLPVAPEDVSFNVQFKTETRKGHADLFLLAANGLYMSYEGEISLSEATTLELKLKLDKVEAENNIAVSLVEVDFLGMRRQP